MEPHAPRRAAILAAHPEVRRLMGPEWSSKYLAIGLVLVPHLWTAHLVLEGRLPWMLTAWAVGATLAQAGFLAIHELSHNLFFRRPAWNRAFSILVNLPLVVPFAIPFRDFHLEHHKHQGEEGVDTDLPSAFECRRFRGPVAKLLWVSGQLVAYALRPVLTRRHPWTRWHVANLGVQLAFDGLVLRYWGLRAIAYLLLCVALAGGLHPCAGHFLSEHYRIFGSTTSEETPQETFSYYGPLNYLTWNVGYHNEHHDFPFVPWSRLPLVTAAAPEWYRDLQVCPSWPGAIVEYVVNPAVGPWSRVRRGKQEEEKCR